MVKSYDRFEQAAVFGVISAQCNIVWLLQEPTQSVSSPGRALTGGLEQILVWDIKTGELLATLSDTLTPGASNAKTSAAPSPVVRLAHHGTTNMVAAGMKDGSIKVWDLTLGAAVVTFSGHWSAVTTLAFDANGTRLLSGSADASIIMWDLVSEEGMFKLKGHKSEITGTVLLRVDGRLRDDELEDFLMSTSKDGLIKLWDLTCKQCVETHLAHSGECWLVGINAKKDMALTCGSKDQVKVWAVDLAQPDGEKVVCRGEFEKQSKVRCVGVEFVAVRDCVGAHEVFFLQNTDRTCELFRVRSSDEIKKAVAKRTKRLREKGLADNEIVQAIAGAEISMLIAPLTTVRGTAKIRACAWAGQVRRRLELLFALANNSLEFHRVSMPEQLRKATPGELTSEKIHAVELAGHRTDVRAMDVSDDNRLLCTASNGELKIWNLKSRRLLRTFSVESGYALCCRFLPGGTLVVVGFKNGALELYDLALSALVHRVDDAHGTADGGCAVWSMDITPDGRTLVTGGNDKKVKFWHFVAAREPVPGTTAEITTLRLEHTQTLEVSDEVLCVRVSGDAKYLAVSLLNNNVQVVFVDTLKLFLTLYGHKLPVLSVDISGDSKLIITSSADKNIKIWGLDFGDCHKSLFAHQDSVMAVRFLPDSHHFFSAGKDGMVKYWDGDKFQCIQKLAAHQSEVWALAVGRDGLFVVSSSHDHSTRIWSATHDQVFLEEEREKEMDELYESELLSSLDDEHVPENAEEDDSANKVRKQTMETLKAGEKLIEAIDIGFADLRAVQEYERQLAQFQSRKSGVAMRLKPTPNAVLLAYNISGQEHVLNTVLKIRASQLEDALLVLPFSYVVKLLEFVSLWTSAQNIGANLVNLAAIFKVLFFIVRTNAKELVSQKDEALRNHLMRVKKQLRGELARAAQQLGYNTQGLKYKRSQWKMEHELEFIDEHEQREHEEKHAAKRTFATV